MELLVAGLVLTWIVLALVCAVLYRLFEAYGRLLLRIEALQGQLEAGTACERGDARRQPSPEYRHQHRAPPRSRPPVAATIGDLDDGPDDIDYATLAAEQTELCGLARGLPAPAFRLPRPDGGELMLDAYRGRRVLLAFVDPACTASEVLLPSLEALHRRESTGLAVLAVSRGEGDQNLEMIARHGLTFPVGVQRHWDISRQYQLLATPAAFLIDERSVIAAEPAIGAEAILRLAGS